MAETIVDYIPGIMRQGTSNMAFSFLGKGKVTAPENAMIITNQRVICVVVPLAGAGQVIAGTNMSALQWMTARGDIEKKLKEMLSSMSIEKIIQSNPKNYSIPLTEIQKVKVNSFFGHLVLITEEQKYKYALRGKEDKQKAKELFKNFL